MHRHHHRVLVDLVGQIEPEDVAEQTEAKPDSTVLSAQDLEGVDIENNSMLSQFGLLPDCNDIIITVFDKAAIASRLDVLKQTNSESNRANVGQYTIVE